MTNIRYGRNIRQICKMDFSNARCPAECKVDVQYLFIHNHILPQIAHIDHMIYKLVDLMDWYGRLQVKV